MKVGIGKTSVDIDHGKRAYLESPSSFTGWHAVTPTITGQNAFLRDFA